MLVIFTKQEHRAYTVTVCRSDRVKLQFQGVGKKFLIPHDLSHLIIESMLGMRYGFWGCVANGALFPGMNIIEGRQKAHAKAKSKQVIKEAHQQLRLAECLVRVFYESSVAHSDLSSIKIQKHLSQISSDIKPKLSNSSILAICSTLKAFESNWQAINVEESIELNWNQKFPSRSLKL